MASSRVDNSKPEPVDARGLLIPNDIISNTDSLKSDPAPFFGSHQFYIKAGFTKEGVLDQNTILKYLDVIPDHHFCHIKSLCLDLGFHDPFLNFLGDKEQSLEFYEWLIGDTLDRGNNQLVVKILRAHIRN